MRIRSSRNKIWSSKILKRWKMKMGMINKFFNFFKVKKWTQIMNCNNLWCFKINNNIFNKYYKLKINSRCLVIKQRLTKNFIWIMMIFPWAKNKSQKNKLKFKYKCKSLNPTIINIHNNNNNNQILLKKMIFYKKFHQINRLDKRLKKFNHKFQKNKIWKLKKKINQFVRNKIRQIQKIIINLNGSGKVILTHGLILLFMILQKQHGNNTLQKLLRN